MIVKFLSLGVIAIALSMSTACGSKKHSSNDAAPAPQGDTDQDKPGQPGSSETPSAKDPGNQSADASKPADQTSDAGKTPAASEDDQPVDNRTACEKSWDDYVSYNEVGDYLLYRAKTVGSNYESIMETKQTVTESDSEHVKWNYETTVSGNTSNFEYSQEKQTFMDGCDNPTVNEPVEEGDAEVTVPAGTYNTHWQRYKTEQATAVSNSKSYMATLASGEKIMVKIESDVDSQYPSSTVQELIETNKN